MESQAHRGRSSGYSMGRDRGRGVGSGGGGGSGGNRNERLDVQQNDGLDQGNGSEFRCSRGGGRSGSGGGGGYLAALKRGIEQDNLGRPQNAVSSGRNSSEGGGGSSPAIDDVNQVAADVSRKVEVSQPPKSSQGQNRGRVPINRPDGGGRLSEKQRSLLVNHFLVKFDPDVVILQYDIDIIRKIESKPNANSKVSKPEKLLVKNEYLRRQFPTGMSATAYDGDKNIYSAIRLPDGVFELAVSKGEDDRPQTYICTIKLVKRLELKELQDYLQSSNSALPRPRDILQALDVIFKENLSRTRIQIGKSFYPKTEEEKCYLGRGIVALRGLQQSLKPTSQGLALCVDYSVNTFLEQLPVINFLGERFGMSFGDKKMSLTPDGKRNIEDAMKNLKVTVKHRKTSQKFVVVGLRELSAKNEKFPIDDPKDPNGKKEIGMQKYYDSKYGKKIAYENLPCLDLSRNGKTNYVPMEFCELVEAQKYPKEELDKEQQKMVRGLALAKPYERKNYICLSVKAKDGPYSSEIFKHFKLGIDFNMTKATGGVLNPPGLKIRDQHGNETHLTPENNCQWNFSNKKVLEGKKVDGWGILDFSGSLRDIRRSYELSAFIKCLVQRSRELGIHMKEEPLFIERSNMQVLENPHRVRSILEKIHKERKEELQVLLCPVKECRPGYHPGYKSLKRICETELGIVTQCCRSNIASKLDDHYVVNMALQINLKMGGSNFVLFNRLPGLADNRHVMFIGADVNHPTGKDWESRQDLESPSIAAVTASMNWPAANKYSSRIRPQKRRTERILEFGSMCLELIQTYARINKVKPEKIILFRDGVGKSQFDMVLNEELADIKSAICSEGYSPTITLVVAQKRHQTRFFLQNRNVEPGTVVDRKIVHPFEFDFYLCSHHGILGTSKATHYHVLWDEHSFTSDQLQQMIYNLCYTFAPSTKPVSLVPPVYYADTVAYRGRQYYEDWVKSGSPASSASSGFSSHASFDLSRFPKVHSKLEDLTFFA
ncbi:protein argonaute 2-like [Aristolochia californica]|uniref:protein argonaute 2-like n=1 Tax=Aristolochia californica TaxID=171875 RepID=UPI0035DA4B6A